MVKHSSNVSRTSILRTSVSSLRSAVVLVALAGPAHAQDGLLTISGQILRQVEEGSEPVTEGWVILHTITSDGGNPADSIRLGDEGRYRFRATADSSTVYLVSTTYDGIAYFSQPVHGFGDPDNVLAPLMVFDTTIGSPVIGVGQRHVVVGGVNEDGSHDVIDIIELTNTGQTTRVSGTDSAPTWTGRLPVATTGFTVGDGDIGADAVALRGDTILVFAPMPPGIKQVTVSYKLPRGERNLRFSVGQQVERFNVLSEDPATEVVEGPLIKRDARVAEGRAFQLFVADTVLAGTAIELRLAGITNYSRGAVLFVVLGMSAALILGVAVASRKTRPAAVVAAHGPEELATQIAALDREYSGTTEATDAESWQRYQFRRAELKEQLKAALAPPSTPG